MWWLDSGILCETISPINLINSSSTPPIHLSSLWRKHLCFTLSKFQLWYHVVNHNTPLHIRVSDLIHLIIESLLPFTNLSLFPLPPAPGNHFSTLLKEHLKVLVWPSGSREGVCASLPSLTLQQQSIDVYSAVTRYHAGELSSFIPPSRTVAWQKKSFLLCSVNIFGSTYNSYLD